MSDEQKPFTWDKKKVLALLLLVLILGLVVVYRGSRAEAIKSIPTTRADNAQFVIAGWDYPDEYGQGITGFIIFENSTGDWLSLYIIGSADPTITCEVESGFSLKFEARFTLNYTHMGLTDPDDIDLGKNYIRSNVTVFCLSEIVFSQQNITYVSEYKSLPDIWKFTYYAIIDLILLAGTVYTMVFTYEIYDGTSYTLLTATSGSVDASSPTGDYTDTHTVNDVFFGGVGNTISVILWVEFATGEIEGFNYAAYWNATGVSAIHIYNHNTSDWVILDEFPNGDDSPLSWDNDTVINEDYYNSTSVGLKFYTTLGAPMRLFVDYFQIETFPAAQWEVISTAEIYFNVQFDMWGYNTGLIIMGLIMIPVSTMYLAYGVKHDRSSDRLFYALIIFMVGCGLLVGGITP